MTDVAADGVSSGDISADAERPDVEADVVCSGDINADVKCSDVEADGVSSGDISADAERPGLGLVLDKEHGEIGLQLDSDPSDVKASARLSLSFKTLKLMLSVQDKVFCKEKSMRYIWLWIELVVFDLDHHGVELVTSVLTLIVQTLVTLSVQVTSMLMLSVQVN
ncbi:Tbc1 Domain Family Member 20 [Manis pentadactyla]|nr:Tbc1 Domain Family Member 20 [Manis pentadactyla]